MFCVCHSTKDTQDELQTIVDYGGHVLDVAVDHPLYGQIRADLIINNRLDVAEFVDRMNRYNAQPLKVFDRGLPLSYSDCGIGEKPGFY